MHTTAHGPRPRAQLLGWALLGGAPLLASLGLACSPASDHDLIRVTRDATLETAGAFHVTVRLSRAAVDQTVVRENAIGGVRLTTPTRAGDRLMLARR